MDELKPSFKSDVFYNATSNNKIEMKATLNITGYIYYTFEELATPNITAGMLNETE